MAFNFDENLALSKVIMMGKNNPSGKYSLNGKEVSYEALNDVLRNNLAELTETNGKFDMYKYTANKNAIYQLLGETLNDVMPKNVLDTYGMFADVKTVAQGDKIVFHKKIGKDRAKQFITRVALAGRYEVFELADEKYTMQTTAYGGAARIAIEEFLDKRVQWSDYLDIVNEGMAEAVYKEIAKALNIAVSSFPQINRVAVEGFNETALDNLIQTVSVYGSPVIYCSLQAAMKIKPTNSQWASDPMKEELWQKGYFSRYKGVPVVILPNSFEHADNFNDRNQKWVIDPAMIYVFPTNGEKPVKVVFEGQTLVKEFENRDWSTEIQTYQKFGVAIMNTANLGVYVMEDLSTDRPVPFTSGSSSLDPHWLPDPAHNMEPNAADKANPAT